MARAHRTPRPPHLMLSTSVTLHVLFPLDYFAPPPPFFACLTPTHFLISFSPLATLSSYSPYASCWSRTSCYCPQASPRPSVLPGPRSFLVYFCTASTQHTAWHKSSPECFTHFPTEGVATSIVPFAHPFPSPFLSRLLMASLCHLSFLQCGI